MQCKYTYITFPMHIFIVLQLKKDANKREQTVIKQEKRSSRNNKVDYAKRDKECAVKHLAGGAEADGGTTCEPSFVPLFGASINLGRASIKEPVSSMKGVFDFAAADGQTVSQGGGTCRLARRARVSHCQHKLRSAQTSCRL